MGQGQAINRATGKYPGRSPMTSYILLALLFSLTGCKKQVADGLYHYKKLIKAGASVEDFCLDKGEAELVRHNKVMLTKGARR